MTKTKLILLFNKIYTRFEELEGFITSELVDLRKLVEQLPEETKDIEED